MSFPNINKLNTSTSKLKLETKNILRKTCYIKKIRDKVKNNRDTFKM